MNNNLTDITVVLDRSGSMSSVANDTKGGFDQFVNDQQKASGEANLTLVQFDNQYEFVHRGKPIKDIPPLDFQPRGSTALLDAIGRAIIETGARLKGTSEHERPSKVVFVIITDGEENSSKEFKRSQINEMIKHQRDIYKWEFVFLGANQDVIKEAGDLGIATASAMSYAHNSRGVKAAFHTTSMNLSSYRAGDQDMAYSDKDRKEAEAS